MTDADLYALNTSFASRDFRIAVQLQVLGQQFPPSTTPKIRGGS